MAAARRELLLCVLQFLRDEGFHGAAHELERETQLFFDLPHLKRLVVTGDWDGAEKYLSGFTAVTDSVSSMEMFFAMHKQKYLEALDRGDVSAAVDILRKDLSMISTVNREALQELASLLSYDNIRLQSKLARYGTVEEARGTLAEELHKLVHSNAALAPHLQLPRQLPPQALLTWYMAQGGEGALGGGRGRPPAAGLVLDAVATTVPVATTVAVAPQDLGLNLEAAHPGQRAAAPGGVAEPLSGGASTSSAGALGGPGVDAAGVPAVRNSWWPALSSASGSRDSGGGPAAKRARVAGGPLSSRGKAPRVGQAQPQLPADVPCQKARHIPADATALEFHPLHQTWLLVGTASGECQVWDLAPAECLWQATSAPALAEPPAPVTRVAWSTDGALLGAAFASCKGRGAIHIHRADRLGALVAGLPQDGRQIDAHAGAVTCIAFAAPDRPVAVSGGEDGAVCVWDAVLGALLHRFSAHEGFVSAVCPHHKAGVHFIFSAGRDGRIKAWLYRDEPHCVDYRAPGAWVTEMAYTSDGRRLFSCGVGREGGAASTLVEWNEVEGGVARHYKGYVNPGRAQVRLCVVADRYLVVGDTAQIKVWDMAAPHDYMTLVCEGLPQTPVVACNSFGSLLAVTTTTQSTGKASVAVFATASGQALLVPPLGVHPPAPALASTSPGARVPLQPAPVARGRSRTAGPLQAALDAWGVDPLGLDLGTPPPEGAAKLPAVEGPPNGHQPPHLQLQLAPPTLLDPPAQQQQQQQQPPPPQQQQQQQQHVVPRPPQPGPKSPLAGQASAAGSTGSGTPVARHDGSHSPATAGAPDDAASGDVGRSSRGEASSAPTGDAGVEGAAGGVPSRAAAAAAHAEASSPDLDRHQAQAPQSPQRAAASATVAAEQVPCAPARLQRRTAQPAPLPVAVAPNGAPLLLPPGGAGPLQLLPLAPVGGSDDILLRSDWPAGSSSGVTNIRDRSSCRVQELEGPSTGACCTHAVAWLEDGAALIAISSDGNVSTWLHDADRLAWQTTSVGEMKVDACHSGFQRALLALSGSKALALAACGGSVVLHDLATRKALHTFLQPPPAATALDLHPTDDSAAAVGLEDGQVVLYDLRRPRLAHHLPRHDARVTAVRFLESGAMVSAGTDAKVVMHAPVPVPGAVQQGVRRYETLWAVQLQATCKGHPPPALGEDLLLTLHPDQHSLAAAHPSQVSVYSAHTGARLAVWAPSSRTLLGAPITATTHSVSGSEVLVAFADGAVGIFDAATLVLNCRIAPRVLDLMGRGLYAVAVAAACDAEGRVKVALGLVDGSVQVWEPKGGEAAAADGAAAPVMNSQFIMAPAAAGGRPSA